MDINKITELGMEKVAADPQVAGLLPGGQSQGLSKKQLAKILAGGAAVGGGATMAGKKLQNMSPEKKQQLKEQLKSRSKGALVGAAGTGAGVAGLGALGSKLTGQNISAQQLKRLAGQGAAVGGALGALRPDKALGKEKQASAEELYVDGLEKIASVTGIEPEVLDQAIGMYNEEMVKEAQIDELLEGLSEEEAGELLKEAADSSPELKGAIAEAEEAEENEELGQLVQAIQEMDDEEAEKLLAEIE